MSDYLYYVHNLHSLFNTGFMEAYRQSNPKKRRRILPYLQAIHRRWYHATLIENTPFTPANLMESLCRHFEQPADSYIVPELKTPSKVTGVDMAVTLYSVDNHPVVNDIGKLISYCSPHVDLCEEKCFTDKQALELAESLSINDPHYASFLLEVALSMKMLNKMPSLYVQRMQISKTCDELLGLPPAEFLHKIVDATISLTAFGLSSSIPVPEHIFTESFVRSLLTKPMETDDIFARVFDVLGYDLEDLLNVSNMSDEGGMNLDLENLGVDMELLSGTFVMGIVLDRFFFTPFGHFLRLIRPMYMLPFEFVSEIGDYASVCEDPEEAFVAFFAPCSSYTITDLGLNVLNVKPNSENYLDVSHNIPFDSMKDTVFSSPETMAVFVEMARHLSPLVLQGGMPGKIYTFRVRLDDDPSAWIHLQIPENCTLHQLYEEIAHLFELIPNDEYSFFHDKTENRFAEYSAPKKPSSKHSHGKSSNQRKAPKKTSDIPLSEMDFDHMAHMIMVAYNQSAPFSQLPSLVRLNLERLNIKEPQHGDIYPKIARASASMRTRL